MASNLADRLAEQRRFIVVVNAGEDACGPYYTAATVDAAFGVRVELACDQLMGSGPDLDEAKRGCLDEIGIAPPIGCGHGPPVVLGGPVDPTRVARYLVRPLEIIYGARVPLPLMLDLHDDGACRPLEQR